MSKRDSLPLYSTVFEDVLLCCLWLKHHIEGEGPQFGSALGLINLTPEATFLVPEWGDIVDYDSGLSDRRPASLYVAWRTGTSNLCHNPLISSSQGLRIWPQNSFFKIFARIHWTFTCFQLPMKSSSSS